MSELLEASLAFPTVSLTIVLAIAFLYWIFVILGALDIDLFSSDADFDGALEGQAGGDADVADVHLAHGNTFLHPLGLRRVPLTISITFIVLFAWVISLLCMYYLGPWVPDGTPRWLFGLLVLFAALFVAMPLTAIAITPLAPGFVVHTAMRARDIIGSTCTVSTGRVDHDFGQARVTDNGAELVISVRCDRDNTISRHEQALVIDYDAERHAYVIEPLDEVFKKQLKKED